MNTERCMRLRVDMSTLENTVRANENFVVNKVNFNEYETFSFAFQMTRNVINEPLNYYLVIRQGQRTTPNVGRELLLKIACYDSLNPICKKMN